MPYLRRKIDKYLDDWKKREHQPLLIKGARQVGKTESIKHFGLSNYESFVYVNLADEITYHGLLSQGYTAKAVISRLSLCNPDFKFLPEKTLICFDEIQEQPDVMTTLKFFKLDGRFDVIASGSLLGVQYGRIKSFSVGYEEDVEMHALDFEEFLWARGRNSDFTDMIYEKMLSLTPYDDLEFKIFDDYFMEYCIVGGMPACVSLFCANGHYQGVRDSQRKILDLYRNDARRYCEGLDQAKIIDVYASIPYQLAKEHKGFQYSLVRSGAQKRDYAGCLQWLEDAGLICRAYCMHAMELPLSGNCDHGIFKVFYPDLGLLIATLEPEAALDFKLNRNFHTYKGAIAENSLAETLHKAGCPLLYYKKQNSTLEIDFLLRSANSLVPIEVKAANGNAKSLRTVIASDKYPEITFGIKLTGGNIGKENSICTFPRFCSFLVPRFLSEKPF